jgi:hypothetical protein
LATCADDDRVLDVGEVLPCDPARDPARGGDGHDGEEPEAEQPRKPRIGFMRDRRKGEEEPAAHRDQLEDADEVVRSRVVGALLVLVVETVELRHDHPGRQAQAEDEQLDLHTDCIGAPVLLEDERRCEEGEREADKVGEHQHPADEPATAHPCGSRAPPLEDVQRPLVQRSRDVSRRGRVDVGLDRSHLPGTPCGVYHSLTCRIHHSPVGSGRTQDARLAPEERGLFEANSHVFMAAMNEWAA